MSERPKYHPRSGFWDKVDKSGDCWLWNASKTDRGYGQVMINGRRRYAHRISYELTKGIIPSGMFVCHRCDVRECVNPDHLFLGTAQDNTNDMMSKGRNKPTPAVNPASGERIRSSKLKTSDVLDIRSKRGIRSAQELAGQYRVCRETIYHIWSGLAWRHV